MPDAYFIASIKAKDFSPEVSSFTNHRTGNQSDFRRNSDFMKKILVRQPFFPIICRSLLIQVKFRKYTYLQSRFLITYLQSRVVVARSRKEIMVNPLNANPEKWSNTLKQIFGNLPTICLSVFDHFMNLALKGLS